MSDHSQRPGGTSAGDSRRIFIPSPGGGGPSRTPAPPAGRGGTSVPAPPRPPYPQDPSRRREGDRPPGPPTRPRPVGPGGPGRRPPGKRPWWKRLRWGRVLLVVTGLMVLGVLGLYWWANSIFNRIEKVDVSDALASGNGTNYLIVGSDSREVLPEDDPAQVGAPGGQRADTMMLLRFEAGETRIMSIPRDLIVTVADTGEEGRINGAYNGGPSRLIRTIQDNLDITIQRYIEVDFVSFAGLVDGLGGITIEFPNPAFDTNSGLNVTQSGPVELDGEQALAYVRSRNYTEVVDGQEVRDPTADLGRIQRQQQFLSALFAELDDAKDPFTLARIASNVADGLRIDDDMSLFDAMRFAWRLRGLNPTPVELPTDLVGPVLHLNGESDAALEQFR